jgi:hypothetical protein
MYPQRELTQLTAYKTALCRDIAVSRAQCVVAAGRISKPLELLDRIANLWRRLSPLVLVAAVPLGFAAQRALFPRLKILRSIVRWGPLAFTVARALGSAVGASKFPADNRTRRTSRKSFTAYTSYGSCNPK